jgi:hypothetical protein
VSEQRHSEFASLCFPNSVPRRADEVCTVPIADSVAAILGIVIVAELGHLLESVLGALDGGSQLNLGDDGKQPAPRPIWNGSYARALINV